MERNSWWRTMVVAAVSVLPAVAWAQVEVSGGGGMFVPYDGTAGPSGLVRVLGTMSDPLRFGGEVEYRSYKSTIFSVPDVHFDSVSIRALLEYKFMPDRAVCPYVGAGFGLNVNVLDGTAVKRGNPEIIDVTDFGVGLGLLGLAGIEVPVSKTVALFVEGRAGVDFQLTSQSNSFGSSSGDVGVSNLGGYSGIGGVRVRF